MLQVSHPRYENNSNVSITDPLSCVDDTMMTSEDQKTYMKVTFNENRPIAPPTSSEQSHYHKIAGYIKVCIISSSFYIQICHA